MTLGFSLGFPEYRSEFDNYSAQLASYNVINTGVKLNQLRQIKNHQLSDLLSFSGIKETIFDNYQEEWLIVERWNPADRYKIRRYNSEKCKNFIKAAHVILKQIR